MNPQSDSALASPTYWKVIQADGKHHDHQWTVGLNVLAGEFNGNASDDCCAGRLYYCEQKDLIHWLSMGDYVVRVIEPVDDPEFRCVTVGANKKGANRLVLTDERYSLNDIETYHRLGIDLTEYTMDDASAHGRVAVLQWHLDRSKDSGLELKYSGYAIRIAFRSGHIAVLQWWLDRSKDSSLELKYDKSAMEYASANGHIAVLQLWLDRSKDSGLELKYSEYAMNYASHNGHIDVLQWWLDRSKDSGLKLKYDEYAMRSASAHGHVAVLQWWLDRSKDSGLELKYSGCAMNYASRNGHVAVDKWWKDSGLVQA
jgi:hypothetical protein